MAEILCLFFPAFLSLNIIDDKLSLFLKIKKYVKFNILINTIVMLVVYFRCEDRSLFFNNMFTLSFTLKYLILASITACILSKVLNFLSSNINIKIDLRKLKK